MRKPVDARTLLSLRSHDPILAAAIVSHWEYYPSLLVLSPLPHLLFLILGYTSKVNF